MRAMGKSGSNVKSVARRAVEQALQQSKRPLTIVEIIARAGLTDTRARIRVENYLRAMVHEGTARRLFADRIPMWSAGSRATAAAETEAAARVDYDPYDGAELRPYEGRPGAMDAFALPSRVGRRRTWRDGRVEVQG